MGSHIGGLPVEILLKVIQYLPLPSLRNVCLLAQYYNQVVSKNDSTVYRAAAVLHGYVSSPSVSFSEAKTSDSRYPMDAATDWKDYCQRCFQLDKSWVGFATASVGTRAYCMYDADVYRIKVDDDRNLLFTSTARGGIRVTDMRTGVRLWETPSDYVQSFSHLEYEQGYVVFDRDDDKLEIWQLCSEANDSAGALSSPAHRVQIAASRKAAAAFPENTRGHLQPRSYLSTHQPIRAYRFVYPTLLIASENAVYLWDVPSGTLVKTFNGVYDVIGDGNQLSKISWVDLNERYLVLCGSNEMRVLGRTDGKLLFKASTDKSFAKTSLKLKGGSPKNVHRVVPLKAYVQGNASRRKKWPRFRAAYMSRSGSDFVGLLSDGRLVLIQDCSERFLGNGMAIEDAALEIDITHGDQSYPEVHGGAGLRGFSLAFKHGRVAVATSCGLHVFTLDAAERGLLDLQLPPARWPDKLGVIQNRDSDLPSGVSFPNLAAAHLPMMGHRRALREVSCLQISATSLFVNWTIPRLSFDWQAGPSAEIVDYNPFAIEEDVRDYWTGESISYRHEVPEREQGSAVCCLDLTSPVDDTI